VGLLKNQFRLRQTCNRRHHHVSNSTFTPSLAYRCPL